MPASIEVGAGAAARLRPIGGWRAEEPPLDGFDAGTDRPTLPAAFGPGEIGLDDGSCGTFSPALDAIVPDVAGQGCFAGAMRLASTCQVVGLDLRRCSGDSGLLGTAAYLHLCAAHPHIRQPDQSLLRRQPLDVIAGEPFGPRGHVVALPTGSGPGVTLDRDRDRLARCARLLRGRGPPDKHRDPDAPGRMRRMPLA